MRGRVAVVAVLVLSSLGVGACGSDDDTEADAGSSPAKTVNVEAANFTFDPTAIELVAGEAVTFVVKNGDQVRHNLTVEGMNVDKDVEAGETAEAAATPEAGTYPFRCEYHPAQMQGTVTVT